MSRIAGLAPVEDVPGLENINLTEFVNGHMAYRAAIPRLLREVGWEVESDEFTEIEDPDPENHEARQRELIREIEGARKEAEAKPEKRRFGIFKRGKLAEKKTWETYDESGKEIGDSAANANGKRESRVLFDIDAIRAELESEQMEVRQLESTLPPMKLDLTESKAATEKIPQGTFPPLRSTKSYDETALPPYSEVHPDIPRINLPNGHEETFQVKNLDEEHKNGDAKATMSFDPHPPLPSAALAWQSTTPPPASTSTAPHRPELRSAATMPAASTGLSLEHNAWADEDEDCGHEKEVKMSFE